ncbi:acyl-coa synthetase [Holotrichia oblita]|uniref:Acyl-coa synthetase n=1 Tax=Holotrichia oblita TaxID=644536 RepID=A0ACB9T4G4_HOLOL|nr:acyl-coa synthetase [Holotrichia oblita]
MHQIGSEPLRYMTIGQLLESTATKYGDRPAIISRGQKTTITFHELLEKADRLAAGLLTLGLQRGDRVGLCLPNRYEWNVVLFACIRADLILGTTGKPKATISSHFNMVNNSYSVARRIELDTKHHIACLPNPLFHAFGIVINTMAALHFGTTFVIPGIGYNPNESLDAIIEEKCSVLYGTPTMYIDLIEVQSQRKENINPEILVTGGALCSVHLFKNMLEVLKVKKVKNQRLPIHQVFVFVHVNTCGVLDVSKCACKTCGDIVKLNENHITCRGICNNVFHLPCVDVKRTEVGTILKKNIKWFCDDCGQTLFSDISLLSLLRSQSEAITKLSEKVDQLLSITTELKSEISILTSNTAVENRNLSTHEQTVECLQKIPTTKTSMSTHKTTITKTPVSDIDPTLQQVKINKQKTYALAASEGNDGFKSISRRRIRKPVKTVETGSAEDHFSGVPKKAWLYAGRSVFGQTEATAVVFHSLPDDDLYHSTATVGYIGNHIEIKVIDAEGNVVPFGKPEKTKETIGADGWLKTGDLFILENTGYGKIVGRLKEMIIRGGENIFPKEIEDFLNTHPDIMEAYVIGVPHARLGEEICAFVRLKEGKSLNHEQMEEFCKGNIAHFKIPRYLKVLTDLPKTASGKVQKFKLKELY